jgi:N-acetylneuraminic acid mutarotase
MTIGGHLDSGAAIYNFVTDTMHTTSLSDTNRWCSAAVKWNGKVVVTGGWNPVTASVEQYDPKTNQWTKLPDLQVARWGHALVNVAGCLYAIGGADVDELVISSIEQYNAADKSWKLVSTLQTARAALASATNKVS